MCVDSNDCTCVSYCRLELSSAQEEYVKLCGEKDRLESAHKKILEQVETTDNIKSGVTCVVCTGE